MTNEVNPITARHLPMSERVAMIIASNLEEGDDELITDPATIEAELYARDRCATRLIAEGKNPADYGL
jgi:hypothetical protein